MTSQLASHGIHETWERLLDRPLVVGENSVSCICHEDEHASCSVNTITGLWYCHTRGSGGDLVTAYSLVEDMTLSEAAKIVQSAGVDTTAKATQTQEKPPISTDIRDIYLEALKHDTKARKYAKKLGWNPETLNDYEIGLHAKLGRYTIPIYDEAGELRNFRMYDPHSGGVNKMISYGEGYGTARLYPIANMAAKTLLLCEGEKDCIRLNQELRRFGPAGWKAVTGTGGASSWKPEWDQLFKDKDVYIVYDRDEAGEKGAAKVAARLTPHAAEVRIVYLDIPGGGADISDYFNVHGRTLQDLQRLIEAAGPPAVPSHPALRQNGRKLAEIAGRAGLALGRVRRKWRCHAHRRSAQVG